MSGRPTFATLSRLGYADGARLLHSDFELADVYEPGWVSAHLRCAHHTWGIGEGLNVILSADRKAVSIRAGIAWNCRGEVLGAPDVVGIVRPLQPAPGLTNETFDLVLRTPDSPARSCAPTIESCAPPRRYVEPRIEWMSLGDTTSLRYPLGSERMGLDLPLGRFRVDASGAIHGPDPSVRRHARTIPSPQLRFGTADGATLTWISLGGNSSAASVDLPPGFLTRPSVVVWPISFPIASVPPLLSLGTASARRFAVRLGVGLPLGHSQAASLLGGHQRGIVFGWMAAGPMRGCPSPADTQESP